MAVVSLVSLLSSLCPGGTPRNLPAIERAGKDVQKRLTLFRKVTSRCCQPQGGSVNQKHLALCSVFNSALGQEDLALLPSDGAQESIVWILFPRQETMVYSTTPLLASAREL